MHQHQEKVKPIVQQKDQTTFDLTQSVIEARRLTLTDYARFESAFLAFSHNFEFLKEHENKFLNVHQGIDETYTTFDANLRRLDLHGTYLFLQHNGQHLTKLMYDKNISEQDVRKLSAIYLHIQQKLIKIKSILNSSNDLIWWEVWPNDKAGVFHYWIKPKY